MQALTIYFLFVLGRMASLFVYRMCWSSGATVYATTRSAIFNLLRRPLPWLAHAAFIWPTLHLTWHEMPALRVFTVVLTALLALGAIGRMGSANLNRFFVGDRCVVLGLSIGVWFNPSLIYPCLIASCCLQYTVASWSLGPGYSNLLGFEFVRGSLSVIVAALMLMGWTRLIHWTIPHGQTILLGAVLLFQASTYANHALAKSSLGAHWHSWIRENRLECLAANAWLRGWTLGRNKKFILGLIRRISRYRVFLCASIWILEISWFVVFADEHLTMMILCATMLFHLVVFLLTGLTGYQYIVSHLTLFVIISCYGIDSVFSLQNFITSLISIPLAAMWIKWLRKSTLTEFLKGNHSQRLLKFSDAADHLMAWWDTPLMRMFSYTVETRSGQQYSLPTPKLSPHDTALTDIHTHMMMFGQHNGLDPLIEHDKKIARVGVWGLTIFPDDRDFLYRLMDHPAEDWQPVLHAKNSTQPWHLSSESHQPHAATALRDMFCGINKNIGHKWFSLIMRWPHFPGEDAASDLCPLGNFPQKRFTFDEPVTQVTLWRSTTFLTRNDMLLIAEEKVGCIHFEET
jgi:hypothetical protein